MLMHGTRLGREEAWERRGTAVDAQVAGARTRAASLHGVPIGLLRLPRLQASSCPSQLHPACAIHSLCLCRPGCQHLEACQPPHTLPITGSHPVRMLPFRLHPAGLHLYICIAATMATKGEVVSPEAVDLKADGMKGAGGSTNAGSNKTFKIVAVAVAVIVALGIGLGVGLGVGLNKDDGNDGSSTPVSSSRNM